MSTVLNEITYQRLQGFRRRRSLLASSRGWSAVVTVFIATLCVAVIVDAVTTNVASRWVASGLIYVATLAAWFGCCWLPRRTPESLQFVAKRFEEVDPRLREQLLTAVEFADDSRSQPHDSLAFKERLQTQVAQLIAPVDVRQLLPWRMVRRWVVTAFAAMGVLLLLALVPQLHWMNRIARALLPSANLDRMAGIAIVIEEPQPNSRIIATGDIVGVVARIEDPFSVKPATEKVLLESRSTTGELSLIPMQDHVSQTTVSNTGEAQPGDLSHRFHATISTEEAWVEYRVIAGDAATKWHRLTTQSRPEVLQFKIALTPPAYAKLPVIEQESSDRNIRALIGTKVRLALTVNQSVSTAEIRWQSQPDATPLRLELDPADGCYVVQFTVERGDSYRIHLQSAETGFNNEFSPTYLVDAVTDQPPELAWTRPASPKQIVASDQVIALAANIQDELPVESVKQRIRINRMGEWQSTVVEAAQLKSSDGEQPAAVEALAGELGTTVAAWQADLLTISTRVGDVVEMKLVAEDRKGQAAESEIVEFLIAETAITVAPTPAEMLRQNLAAEFEAFDQRIKQQEVEVQTIAKLASSMSDEQRSEQRLQQSAKLAEASTQIAADVQQEIPKLLALIEQAASETEDSVSLQELEQAGQALTMLKAKNLHELNGVAKRLAEPESPLTTKQRGELEKELVQQVKRFEQAGQSVAEGFRAMVTHDVGRRVSGQVVQLEELFSNFVESLDEPAAQGTEQLRRRSVVLSRQLLELQQSMLDALPGVRQETKQRVRQSADSLSNLVAQIDNLNPQASVADLKKQVEQVRNSLSQMKSASWFDGGLHDAIINGHRKFSELAGQPAEQLRSAISNLVKEKDDVSIEISTATVDAVLENLGDRRSLLRSRQEGDREFASDLGGALRAVREISRSMSLTKSDQQRELTETSKALETLQAAHGLNEVSTLLEDLLRGERWSLSTSDARVHHPILFNSFAERLDNALKLMRQANLPNELVSAVERMRWHEATNKAGQKLNGRRWENAPLVSAAAELNQVSEQLALSKAELEPLVRAAREKLAGQAPSLEELAIQAAKTTRELQQQTASLADAAARNELPEEAKQIAQLQSQQRQAEEPIAMLRDALVDHADAQNLLEEKQLMTARESDAALAVVDSAKEDLVASMQLASATGSPPADQPANDEFPGKASLEKEPLEKASLTAAADKQAAAAEKLEQLAKHFQQAGQPSDQDQNKEQSTEANALMQLANELGENTESQKQFDEAAQLARLAAARPEEVLRQLEQKLSKSPPMQAEMSRIAKELAEQALNRLDRAASQQQKMQPALEASDPRFQAQKILLLQDLQSVRDSAKQVLGLLVSEAKWTAGAGKEEAAQKQLEATESQLRAALAANEKANTERTFDELRGTAEALQQSLSAAQSQLAESSKNLQTASSREVHQNDADLANRRREMQDRQRRIAQQDVRNLEQFERAQQQLLRQSENELKQATQREKSLDQHRANLDKEVAKQPENESLKQQLADAQRNLAYGRAQKETFEQTKQRLAQRVESAAKDRAALAANKTTELNAANPSAQLSGELTRVAAERSAKLAERLAPWSDAAAKGLQVEASTAQLQNLAQEERSVEQSVQDSSSDLARAARHEGRLQNQPASKLLAEQADATEKLNASEIKAAEQALDAALASSKRADAATGQADASSTQSAESQIAAADAAIKGRADQLRTMLNELNKQAAASPDRSQANSEAAADSGSPLLDSKQLAQLLDEVDRQLSLGQKDNDAAGQESASSRKQTPSTLAAAAEEISSQLSRNRTPTPQANSDQAMATDSNKANVDPQGPVAVKVVDVNRIGADWGKLRARAAEDMIESQRESVSPVYRQQIEAYFRSLAERGQATDAKK